MITKQLTDKELININKNKHKNSRDYWKFNRLSKEELNRMFDLI